MKRLAILFCLLTPFAAWSQSTQFADSSVGTSVHVLGITTANAATTTGYTSWQFALTKSDGATSNFTPTVSGGNNDCTAETHSLYCELTSTQLNTVGPTLLSWSGSGILPGWAIIQVNAAAGMDCWRDGSCVYTIQKNTASQKLPIWMLDSSGVAVTGLAAGSIACSISIDHAAFATTNDTTEAEVGLGLYTIDLTQAETNGNNLDFSCTGTGAAVYRVSLTPQR